MEIRETVDYDLVDSDLFEVSCNKNHFKRLLYHHQQNSSFEGVADADLIMLNPLCHSNPPRGAVIDLMQHRNTVEFVEAEGRALCDQNVQCAKCSNDEACGAAPTPCAGGSALVPCAGEGAPAPCAGEDGDAYKDFIQIWQNDPTAKAVTITRLYGSCMAQHKYPDLCELCQNGLHEPSLPSMAANEAPEGCCLASCTCGKRFHQDCIYEWL